MGDKKRDKRIYVDPNYNLQQAMRSNSFTDIKVALGATGVDINAVDEDGLTPLMRLCRAEVTPKSRRTLAHEILENSNLNINFQNSQGLSAIAMACLEEKDDIIRVIGENLEVDPNLQDNEGNSPLFHAASTGNADVVATMIMCFRRFGLDVNRTNHAGVSPLLEAARLGYTEVCRVLVNLGQCDLTLRDKICNATAQEYAIESQRCRTPDILLLSPIAQRKRKAKQERQSRGRKILSDYFGPGSHNVTYIVSDFDCKSFRGVPGTRLQLSTEHMNTKASLTYPMARRVMERVQENPIEEEKEEEAEKDRQPQLERRLSSSMPNLGELKICHSETAKKPTLPNTSNMPNILLQKYINKPSGRFNLPPVSPVGSPRLGDRKQFTPTPPGSPLLGKKAFVPSPPLSPLSSPRTSLSSSPPLSPRSPVPNCKPAFDSPRLLRRRDTPPVKQLGPLRPNHNITTSR